MSALSKRRLGVEHEAEVDRLLAGLDEADLDALARIKRVASREEAPACSPDGVTTP